LQNKRLSKPTIVKIGSTEMPQLSLSKVTFYTDPYTNLTLIFLIVLTGASITAKFGTDLWYKLTILLTAQYLWDASEKENRG
jgi:hypothetical protein